MKYIKSRHHSEDASATEVQGEERVDAYEASYERDETTGPLKQTQKKGSSEHEKFKERVSHEEKGFAKGA